MRLVSLILTALVGLTSVPAFAAPIPRTDGLLSDAQSQAVLDNWRHEDQDAYGSETFDYQFVRFQCFQFQQLECHLAYQLEITKVDSIDIRTHTTTDKTPPYQTLELPLNYAGEPSFKGWIASAAAPDGHGYYEGHCMLVLAAGDVVPQLFDARGGVTTAFAQALDVCLSAGDERLTALVLTPAG